MCTRALESGVEEARDSLLSWMCRSMCLVYGSFVSSFAAFTSTLFPFTFILVYINIYVLQWIYREVFRLRKINTSLTSSTEWPDGRFPWPFLDFSTFLFHPPLPLPISLYRSFPHWLSSIFYFMPSSSLSLSFHHTHFFSRHLLSSFFSILLIYFFLLLFAHVYRISRSFLRFVHDRSVSEWWR